MGECAPLSLISPGKGLRFLRLPSCRGHHRAPGHPVSFQQYCVPGYKAADRRAGQVQATVCVPCTLWALPVCVTAMFLSMLLFLSLVPGPVQITCQAGVMRLQRYKRLRYLAPSYQQATHPHPTLLLPSLVLALPCPCKLRQGRGQAATL